MDQIADFIGIQNIDNAMIIVVLAAMAFVYVFCCEVYFRENKPMSSDQKVVVSSQGVSFFGLLFIVLLVLKLGVVETAVVGWSWWWITAPLWAPTCLVLGIIMVIFIVILAIFLGGFCITALVSHWGKVKAHKKERTEE